MKYFRYRSLPLEESAANRVAVYFYNGRWIPIMICSFAEAINLCRNAHKQARELFIFPIDFHPDKIIVAEEIFEEAIAFSGGKGSSATVTQASA